MLAFFMELKTKWLVSFHN